EHDHEIVPVINKIDLPSADVEGVKAEIEEVIGLDASDAIPVSAKEGIGIEDVLEAVVNKIPPPKGSPDDPLRALIFDSWYDSYRGVVMLVRILEGRLQPRQPIQFWSSRKKFEVQEVGYFLPRPTPTTELAAGEVGFVVANVKDVHDAKVGDTIIDPSNPASEPFPGFKVIKPMVFSGIFPVDSSDYEDLREALEKLRLNDSSFTFEPETSQALGFGFRCGYLGLLHMEIVQERLEREYGLDLITTSPSVVYRVHTTKGEVLEVDNPAKLPPPQHVDHLEEPILTCNIHTPNDYVGAILRL